MHSKRVLTGGKMKKGDILLAEIKEYNPRGLIVFVREANQTIMLPDSAIVGGIKKKHSQMIGWHIPVRVISTRPLSLTNMRLDKSKLKQIGFSGSEPVNPNNSNVVTANPEVEAKEVKQIIKDETKELEASVKSLPYGLMVWWKKIKDAASYYVKLYITKAERVKNPRTGATQEKTLSPIEIAVVEIDRNTAYHTFTNLARIDANYGTRNVTGMRYGIEVMAEDREGKIIAKSQNIVCIVE